MNISIQAKKEIRSWLIRNKGRDRNDADIIVEEGASSPRWAGGSFHFETKGGRQIYHPSAYSKVGWSSMRYVPSTRHIVVGKKWVTKLEIDLIQVKMSRQQNRFVHREIANFSFYFG